jgi:F-type H+-transporting ATPase subunit gamma
MLSRLAGNQGVALATGARGFATAQQLKLRIRSVQNIKKITAAMKMVAACKLRKSQEALDRARALNSMTKVWPEAEFTDAPSKLLTVAISGDKGLCGGVNSSIVRAARDLINQEYPEGADADLIIYGEKAKQGLERLFPNQLHSTFSENGKLVPLEFNQTLEISDAMTQSGYDQMNVYFQYFRSMISYETTRHKWAGWERTKANTAYFNDYEMEGDSDCLQNLWEFRHAVALHYYFAENDTSTLSSRMAAMDNSTKNAGEMIEKLTIVLNRNRQAKITTELTEIISGAAAVEESE